MRGWGVYGGVGFGGVCRKRLGGLRNSAPKRERNDWNECLPWYFTGMSMFDSFVGCKPAKNVDTESLDGRDALDCGTRGVCPHNMVRVE